MSLPPERPTEQLRPSGVPVIERPLTAGVDPSVLVLRLEDAVASLRTGLMVAGIIAVAALGVAIYGLLKNSDGAASGSASAARVASLEGRVDRLSRHVESLSGAVPAQGAGLDDRVAALERTVKQLAERPAPGDATAAVKELSSRIDDVASEVDQLKQGQSTP